MDEKDILIIQQLMQNSRKSYQEIANSLDLSLTAVHKRIQGLLNLGIIRNFTARIDFNILEKDMTSIWIWGKSNSESLNEAIQTIGEDSRVYWITVGSGNFLYIGAYLKSISNLDSLIEFVKEKGNINKLELDIIYIPFQPLPVKNNTKLTKLDYKIIYSLHKDARKRLSYVSKELGVSVKTVRNRLNKMIDGGAINFSLDFYPDASNDIFAIFHLKSNPAYDKNKIFSSLFSLYSQNIFLIVGCRNHSNLILTIVWTNTLKELSGIKKRFENDDMFNNIEFTMIHNGYIFDTWRDELIKKNAASKTI